jgi:hypothetical protein
MTCTCQVDWLPGRQVSNRSLAANLAFCSPGAVLFLHDLAGSRRIVRETSIACGQFPKQKNRELFEANREITKLNRDQPAAVRHHLRNSLWPCPDTVLTGGRRTGIQRSPSATLLASAGRAANLSTSSTHSRARHYRRPALKTI